MEPRPHDTNPPTPAPPCACRRPGRPWRPLLVILLVGAFIAWLSLRQQHRFRPTLHWETSRAQAVARATQEGLPILMVFTQPGCPPCVRLEKQVLETPAFEALANGRAVLAMLDATDPPNRELLESFGGRGTPTVIMTNPVGRKLGSFEGEGTHLLGWLERMLLAWDRSREMLITTQPADTQPATDADR